MVTHHPTFLVNKNNFGSIGEQSHTLHGGELLSGLLLVNFSVFAE